MVLALILVATAVVVVGAAGVVAFLDVAFKTHDGAVAVSPREWRTPPQLRGRDLYRWLSATAERAALGVLSGRRDAGAAGRLAAAVQAGATAAGGMNANASDPAFCSTRIGVSPPEAIEIARHLRDTHADAKVERIRQTAAENAARLLEASETPVRVRCPLACEEGTCAAASVRPVQCRVRCELFGHEIDATTAERAQRGELIAAGAEHGLSRALGEAGLDGRLYELNSALARSLTSPDSARRWASGVAVFEGCSAYVGDGAAPACASAQWN